MASKAQLAKIGKLKAEGRSAAEIGVAVGLSCDQVKRAWGAFPRYVPAPEKRGSALGGDSKDREIVRLRDENARLVRELRNVHRSEVGNEALFRVIKTAADAPLQPPDWLVKTPQRRRGGDTPQALMTIWSDWHGGESVSYDETNGANEFNTRVLEERVRRLVQREIAITKEHGPDNIAGAVVNLLGDFVSGGLHPELAKTDEEEVLPAALRCVELLSWGLAQMADAFGRVYVPMTAGNHGRGTPKPEFKRYIYKNFDWLIYKLLIREFEARKDDRVQFDLRPANEVLYRVFDRRFFAMHGDMLGVKGGDGIIGSIGPIMRGEVKVRGYASALGMGYDTLLIGHWHNELWLPNAIVAGTLKGYDEYAKNALRVKPAEPSQPMWYLHPRYGITSRWTIQLGETDAPTQARETPWVSIFDPARKAA